MKFETASADSAMQLTHALLFYSQGSNKQAGLVTVHDVEDVGTKKKPNLQIMAGRPITQQDLLKMVSALADRAAMNTEILPPEVLSISANHIVWWAPARKRQVFFKNAELGERGAIVPHPPLLFVVSRGQGWSIFSLEKNERPTKDTELFHSPYFNVYDDGRICTGSAAVPTEISVDSIAQWEEAFFNSAFTHVNGKAQRIVHERGMYSFWKEMLDGVYAEYPMQTLVKVGATLGTSMAGVRSQSGA